MSLSVTTCCCLLIFGVIAESLPSVLDSSDILRGRKSITEQVLGAWESLRLLKDSARGQLEMAEEFGASRPTQIGWWRLAGTDAVKWHLVPPKSVETIEKATTEARQEKQPSKTVV